MPSGSQHEVDILGRWTWVEFVPLRHGMRVDCHFEVGGRRRFFRCRAENAALALSLLRAEVRAAWEAEKVKILRRVHGLRVV